MRFSTYRIAGFFAGFPYAMPDNKGAIRVEKRVSVRPFCLFLAIIHGEKKGGSVFKIINLIGIKRMDWKFREKIFIEKLKKKASKKPTRPKSDPPFVVFHSKYKKSFYIKDKWLELRRHVFRIYGYKCMDCGKSGKKGLHVDHIYPVSKFPQYKLAIRNLQVLCERCNFKKSDKNFNDFRSEKQKKDLEIYCKKHRSDEGFSVFICG